MWTITRNGFYSVVQDRDDPDVLLVRSRHAADAEHLHDATGADIIATPWADYPYRSRLTRDQWTQFRTSETEQVTYDNFKDSVTDDARHRTYTRVWNTLLELEDHA